jgi:hypothetical protein
VGEVAKRILPQLEGKTPQVSNPLLKWQGQ